MIFRLTIPWIFSQEHYLIAPWGSQSKLIINIIGILIVLYEKFPETRHKIPTLKHIQHIDKPEICMEINPTVYGTRMVKLTLFRHPALRQLSDGVWGYFGE